MAISKVPSAGTVCVPIGSLRPGAVLKSPVFDHANKVLLIDAGIELTAAHVENLALRGVAKVRVGSADLAGVSSPAAAASRRSVAAGVASSKQNQSAKPFAVISPRDQTAAERKQALARFSAGFNTSVVEIRNLFERAAKGSAVTAGQVFHLAESSLADMAVNLDLYLLVGLEPDEGRYPFSHAAQVSRLAMGMGAMLGFDAIRLVELGIGCLLHDLGMLRLNPELLHCERPLDRLERLDISKHPGLTLDMIRDIPRLSQASRIVAYQMHERLDGSGYPRGRTAAQIHPLSKVAMVADTLVAMTSPRPYRPAIQAYYAITEILEMTRQGQFDPEATKALLESISLFPLGSYVELSDGRTARVIGANRGNYSRPIVEAPSLAGDTEPEVVDLIATDGLSILRPALNPDLMRALLLE